VFPDEYQGHYQPCKKYETASYMMDCGFLDVCSIATQGCLWRIVSCVFSIHTNTQRSAR